MSSVVQMKEPLKVFNAGKESEQITFNVTPKVKARLREGGEKLGYATGRYAKMLFEAGYAARIGQERDQPPIDRELDDQVRLVFALAGQADTKAIAKAVGIPEERVVRILDGWREVGKGEKPAKGNHQNGKGNQPLARKTRANANQ